MRPPAHLTPGTPQMAEWLRAMWVPEDFPCREMGFDLVDHVPTCRTCGRALVRVGHDIFHPDTPALAFALEHPELCE